MSVAVERQVRVVMTGQLHRVLDRTATLNDRRDVGVSQAMEVERLWSDPSGLQVGLTIRAVFRSGGQRERPTGLPSQPGPQSGNDVRGKGLDRVV